MTSNLTEINRNQSPLLPSSMVDERPAVEDLQASASEESEKTRNLGNDISESIPPLDIWSAEYPDGGARAWLVVFGVSIAPSPSCNSHH
jgi:hypothetical protein